MCIFGGIGINDKFLVGIRIGTEDGIQDVCLDHCKFHALMFSPDVVYIFLGECGDGLKNLGTVGNVLLNKVNCAKEIPDFLDVVRN